MMDATAEQSRLRRIGLPMMAIAGGVSALGYLRQRFVNDQMFVPDRYPNGVWNPQSFGLLAQDCWFSAVDGVDLHGWWIPQRKAKGTLLYCHGNTGSLAHQIGVLRYLKRLKMNVFAFDYRGYGRSGGRPSEAGLYRDVRAAHRYVTAELGQEAARVLLLGHSLGGAVAIDAALDCPLAGLIVQSSLTETRQAAKDLFPSAPLHWLTRPQFRSVEKVSQLDLPKLFVHGGCDETLPVAHGEQLYAAAADPKQLYVVASGGHNDVHRHGGLSYLRRLAKFRDLCLSSAA